MTETQENTARIRFLLTSLGIVLIFILTLVVILAAYPAFLAPPPTSTPTKTRTFRPTSTITPSPTITLTPTITRTPRPTFTPTITLTPTRTPTLTLTPTPTGPPTLTPASPPVGSVSYKLNLWSPASADYLISLLEYYPNTLLPNRRGENDENYYQAFHYAKVALMEALMRYPDAPQAPEWRWKLAYDQARSGDAGAGDTYADLIAGALNRGQVKIEDLSDWVRVQEPRIEMKITRLDPLTGTLSGRLLQIKGGGSAFILLLETTSAYQALALTSDYDFANSPEYLSFTADLTGDSVEEIVIYLAEPLESLDLAQPSIFSLTQVPPRELSFNPIALPFSIGMDYTVQWVPIPGDGAGSDLQVRDTLFPACPLSLQRTFTWDGTYFQPGLSNYQVDPSPATLSFCRFLVDHAASVWGADAALQIMQPILPDWPPAADEEGKAFPADAQDEWRYRIGIYHALMGNAEEAMRSMQAIIDAPSIANSSWISPARDFLVSYTSADDIYRACVQSERCDASRALSHLVDGMGRNDFSQVVTLLAEAGVSMRATGYFDVDLDGSREVWFTLRHRSGEKLEAWILADYTGGIKALPLGGIDTNTPEFSYYDEERLPPVVLINNARAIRMERLEGTREPYLTYPELPKFYPDRFKEAYQAAMTALFNEEDAAQVYKTLRGLQTTPGLLCRGTATCDEYYYVLGLAAELAGDPTAASQAYVQLWRDYGLSPYTTMARLKLIGISATQTPSPFTPTPLAATATLATGTITGVATPTGPATLTPTATQTLSSAQATSTPTATSTAGTPYPPKPTYVTNTPYP